MEKKYRLTDETVEFLGRTLHRIEALKNFATSDGALVRVGKKGGWVESENNLSHDGDAWVYGDARVYDNARVYGDAQVYGDARVYGNAWVYDNARVYGDALVYGDARVYEPWHILVIGPIGSRNDYTTFFRGKDEKIYVRCGCFTGNINEFAEKVKETHGDNHHGKIYKLAIEMAKEQIEVGGTND